MPLEAQQAINFVSRIIQEQEYIIGPVAWEEASKVTGLRIDVQTHAVVVEGNSRDVLEKLVAQYERLFGPASREVCRDAVKPLLAQVPPNEVPAVLQ